MREQAGKEMGSKEKQIHLNKFGDGRGFEAERANIHLKICFSDGIERKIYEAFESYFIIVLCTGRT